MELVIAAVVLAGGIVAAATLYGRRTVATVDGAPEDAAGEGRFRQQEEQLARNTERTQSLERSLDRRSDELERRADELTRRERALEAIAARRDDERVELDRLHEEHTRALERVAGLTPGQAKQALLKDVEDQARHDSARIIRQVEEETKRDAERRVRSILSVAMQRLAASHAAETTVSV